MKGINFHPKRCGEIAELAFSFKACGMGFVVSKPYGDSAAYDFVVGAKKHLRRVQVKSTSSPGFGRYNVGAQHFHGRGAHAYTHARRSILWWPTSCHETSGTQCPSRRY